MEPVWDFVDTRGKQARTFWAVVEEGSSPDDINHHVPIALFDSYEDADWWSKKPDLAGQYVVLPFRALQGRVWNHTSAVPDEPGYPSVSEDIQLIHQGVPNNFVASWELVRAGLKAAGDLDGGLPYNPGLVTSLMIPGSSFTRDSDRTQITQYELGIAFNVPIAAAPALGIGVTLSQALALANSSPTLSTLGGDGLPPLYLARSYPPGNSGTLLISAIGNAVNVAIATIISTFLGVAPPNPALATGVIYPAWQSAGGPFVGASNILDATIVRFIAAAYQGGEG